jgi:hypothetical protein
VFAFPDVSDVGKNAVSTVMIIFLCLFFIRTVFQLVIRKVQDNDRITITQALIESLSPPARMELSLAITDYQILHRKRVLEIEQKFAIQRNVMTLLSLNVAQETTTHVNQENVMQVPNENKIQVVSTPLRLDTTGQDARALETTTDG